MSVVLLLHKLIYLEYDLGCITEPMRPTGVPFMKELRLPPPAIEILLLWWSNESFRLFDVSAMFVQHLFHLRCRKGSQPHTHTHTHIPLYGLTACIVHRHCIWSQRSPGARFEAIASHVHLANFIIKQRSRLPALWLLLLRRCLHSSQASRLIVVAVQHLVLFRHEGFAIQVHDDGDFIHCTWSSKAACFFCGFRGDCIAHANYMPGPIFGAGICV
jgi:hypothetical protein